MANLNCEIQTVDEATYLLLERGEHCLLLKSIDAIEYIVAINYEVQENKYQWEQARYFISCKDATSAFILFESEDSKRSGLRQKSVADKRKIAIIQAIAKDTSAKRICSLHGRKAFIETLVWLIRGRPRIFQKLRDWAATFGAVPNIQYCGIRPTANQIKKTWEDAKNSRLF